MYFYEILTSLQLKTAKDIKNKIIIFMVIFKVTLEFLYDPFRNEEHKILTV